MPDSLAVVMLSNIRKAMSPHSRLLIRVSILDDQISTNLITYTEEYLIQTTARVPTGEYSLEQAQPPLLPNYGLGRIRQYYTDAAMMVLCNGGERSLDEYTQLAKDAGLHFIRTWDLGEMFAIEFAPAPSE